MLTQINPDLIAVRLPEGARDWRTKVRFGKPILTYYIDRTKGEYLYDDYQVELLPPGTWQILGTASEVVNKWSINEGDCHDEATDTVKEVLTAHGIQPGDLILKRYDI